MSCGCAEIGGKAEVAIWSMGLLRRKEFRLSLLLADAGGGLKMKINKITYQYRRDFQAIYECEGCGHRVEGGGYDDANFHQNVIPSMRCPEC